MYNHRQIHNLISHPSAVHRSFPSVHTLPSVLVPPLPFPVTTPSLLRLPSRKQPLHHRPRRRHLPLPFVVTLPLLLLAPVLLLSRPSRSLGQEHSIKPRPVRNRDIRPRLNKRLHTLQMRIQRSPVQRRVPGVVAVVNDRLLLLRLQALEETR